MRITPQDNSWAFWRRVFAVVCGTGLILACNGRLLAQPRLDANPWSALPEASFQPRIPRPEQFFGNEFHVGRRPLYHHELVSYLDTLDRLSRRVSSVEYARSYGGRPLKCYIITSPRHQQHLESIVITRQKWCDPFVTSAEVPTPPLAVYLAFSVHGNEASGANAAPVVAYYLAAAQSAEVRRLLDQCVVLLDPCLNPDGYERFVHWVGAFSGRYPSSDPLAKEHREPWPGGRTNYYWFDLNRDWLPAQHPETQGRLALIRRWKPNTLFDFHEMSNPATFFLQPGVPSRKNPLIPDENVALTEAMAGTITQQFDRHGVLYFTREKFDDFYPGKGSTYMDFLGAVGILFEQGSTRGAMRRTNLGEMTFGFTVRNQVLAAVGALQAVCEHGEHLAQFQRSFYRNALEAAKAQPARGFLVSSPGDPGRLQAFARLLDQHGISYWYLTRQVTVGDEQFLPHDSILIPAEQKEFRLWQALIQETREFNDSVFYDISAWNVLNAFGLTVKPLSELPSDSLLSRHESLSTENTTAGALIDWQTARYVVVDWRSYYAPKILWQVLEKDIPTLVARRAFVLAAEAAQETWPAGTLVVPVRLAPNAPALLEPVLQQAAEKHVRWQAVASGRSSQGPDLGSEQFVVLRRPRLALLAGRSIEASGAGELWYLLDHRLGIPVTLIDVSDADTAQWQYYTVVILPPGDYSQLSDNARNRLRQWVEQGGTLISLATAAAVLPGGMWAETELFQPERPNVSSAVCGEQPGARTSRAERIPGTILRAEGTSDHPLLYGIRLPLAVFRNHGLLLRGASPTDAPLVYSRPVVVSGYLPEAYQDTMPGTAAARVVRIGRGSAIVLMDSPAFRGYWYSTDRLFSNAVFFGQLINAGGETP